MRMRALCGYVAGGLLLAISAAVQAEAPRTTLEVGVWTLHPDHELTVAPLGPDATLKRCVHCAPVPFVEQPLRASGDGILSGAEKPAAGIPARKELWFPQGVRLRAHGESLSLFDAVRVRSVGGVFQIVATVPVERYVEWVVTAESGPVDSAESRKALAVVVRSYALDRTRRHEGFDLCDATHCQWLRWHSTPEAHQATLATAGESLWFADQRMGALFHQNCGGRTAAASELWPHGAAQGGMTSQTDIYCQRTGSSEWTASLSRTDLQAALARAGLAAPGWHTLRVAERSASGRVARLEADQTRMGVEDFRLAVGRALGWNQIRSDWFEVSPALGGFLFHGRGSGHGVGLCQTGAAEMARQGKSCREILAAYFPKARAAEVENGRAWLQLRGAGFELTTATASDAQYLPELNRALSEAEARSGLHGQTPLAVRSFPSTPAFRNATLAPGWVAAFTEGSWIGMQPLGVLAGRKLLARVALHEFLHALVEAQSTARAPLWLREGLVEVWAGEVAQPKPALTMEQTSTALAHARSEAESEQAHRAAAWYAAQVLQRIGREQAVQGLRNGLPQSLLTALR